MKVFKKILSIVFDTLLLLILVISSLLVISSITSSKTGFPSAFGYSMASVQSPSMSGVFEEGDLIILKLVDENTVIKVGDIVTYTTRIQGVPTTITHEVIIVTEAGDYVTKGVANLVDDGVIDGSRVIATYVDRIEGLGKVVDFLKEPVGFVLCVVMPLSLYIIIQITYLIKLYLDKKKEEMINNKKNETSDDVKEAIIREFLEKQKQIEQNEQNKNKEQ